MNKDGLINILLVDDRPENLLALEAILEHEDYHLIKASSGEEALKYLLKYEFAAILLDVQMPGIDGFGTAKIIKARQKTRNIPILFITANNLDSEHIFMGYSVGAIDYILKPVDPVILKAKVEGFVELFKLNNRLKLQAESLAEKTRELEDANLELSKKSSELVVSEEIANVISDTSIDTMLVTDENGSIVKVNPAVKKMFQFNQFELIGKSISILLQDGETKGYVFEILEQIKNLQYLAGLENIHEITAVRRNGSVFPAEIQIGKRYVKKQCLIAITIRDISIKKQYEEKIKHMAYHDSLTNLPNRLYFNEQLALKLNSARQSFKPLVIMYVNMDRFKYINDSLGHLLGDRILLEIAERLSSCARENDLVARVGGDEFNLLLPDTDRETALDIAETIIESFKTPFHLDNYELYITACIGISIFPYDGDEPSILMRNADAALYRAKEQGKNHFRLFHSGMNLQSYKTFILQNDLRKAIESQEMSLVFQPRICLETGEIISGEALLRWNHPAWGSISPAEFIPLAEETGQISTIGNWVFKTVCLQLIHWQQSGYTPVRISVNFSAHQFLQKNMIHSIQQILTETNANPKFLEIEITESVLMGNEEIIINTLNQLKSMGFSISIDDFGTGYSSLSYLNRLPVDTLKIDRSFIKEVDNPLSNSGQVIATIISLAHSLNMTVVAEGVETEEQVNFLKRHKCQEAQGYLFSIPIPPNEFTAFLTSHDKHSFRKGLVYLEQKEIWTRNETKTMEISNKSELSNSQDVLMGALNHTQEMYSISSREMDVFRLLVNGLSNKEISDELFISEHTVKNHITKIFQKLDVSDRLQAMAKVYQACIEETGNLR